MTTKAMEAGYCGSNIAGCADNKLISEYFKAMRCLPNYHDSLFELTYKAVDTKILHCDAESITAFLKDINELSAPD